MNDRIFKQSYDCGYDAGEADKAKTSAKPGVNPYKPVRYLRTYSRFELWDMGYADGFAGRKRRITQSQADELARERLAQLETFRSRVLQAFAAHRIHCDCAGITHDSDCPLGELEVEADAIWRNKEAVAS